MSIFSLVGWFFALMIAFQYFKYWASCRAVIGPYMAAKNSNGKKILMLIDNGVDGYKFVAAKKEALGYTVKGYGNFEAYEKGIKRFYKTSLGLAHAALEVMIPPEVAVWLKAHGKEITRENINSLPDAFQYLYCSNKVGHGKEKVPCGWVGPLLPVAEGRELSVMNIWREIKGELKKEAVEPVCPDCGNTDLLTVETDASISTIPNRVIYDLSTVREYIDEVVSPLNMDMAIERTKINTMRTMQDSFGTVLKWMTVMLPLFMVLGIVYVMVASQSGGGMAESVESVAGDLSL